MVSLDQLSALEVAPRLKSGELSVEAYAKALLASIQEREHEIRAWAYLNPELVLSEAKKLDQIPLDQRGPLFGLPIGIKDVFLTKGKPDQFPFLTPPPLPPARSPTLTAPPLQTCPRTSPPPSSPTRP
jgi:Asp-tRNA(Asn)/Glu-tRNA(Gln) amidotransferase A subunit family amidase